MQREERDDASAVIAGEMWLVLRRSAEDGARVSGESVGSFDERAE